MRGLLALLLVAMATVGNAQAQAAAGAPADPNGWVKEIATANKLLAAGYVDAAQKDFESVIQRYPATVAGIDKAWLGLSKIHMARYDYAQGKVSLEEVLHRNLDPESVTGARVTYRQLKQEADGQAQQAQKALQFLEMRYAQTSWLNPFAKLFTYLDLKKARTAAETASAAANEYDPHYFIDDVQASAILPSYTLSGSEFVPAGFETPAATASAAPGVSVHTPAPGASVAAVAVPAIAASGTLSQTGLSPHIMPVEGASPTPVAAPAEGTALVIPGLAASPAPAASPAVTPVATASVAPVASLVVSPSPAPSSQTPPSPAPLPIVLSASPAPAASPSVAAASSTLPAAGTTAAAQPDLLTLQRAYQNAYRELQKAITMGNQSQIVTLNKQYQTALEAYRKAAAEGRR